MASTAGLGGLPVLPSNTSVPLSTRIFAQAEYAKRYEDLIDNQAATQAAHETIIARDTEVARWFGLAGGLEAEIKTRKAREGELVGDKELLQEKFNRLEADTQPLREQKAAVDKQLAGALTVITTLTEQVNERQTEKDELGDKVAEQQQEAEMVGRLNAFKLRNSNDEHEEAIKRFGNERQTLANKLAKADAEIDRLQRDLELAQIATDALLSEKSDSGKKLDGAIALASARLADLEKEKEVNKHLTSAKAKADQDFDTANTTATDLQADLDQTARKLSTAAEYNKVLQREFDAATALNDKAHADNVKLKSDHGQLMQTRQKLLDAQSTLKQSLDANEQLKTAVAESDETKANFATQIEAHTKADTKLRSQYQQCVQENIDLHELFTKSAEALKMEQSITAGLRNTVTGLQQQVDDLQTTVADLEADVQRERHIAGSATAMAIRRQTEDAEFLRSTTAPPTPLKTALILPHAADGQVKGEQVDTPHGAPPTTLHGALSRTPHGAHPTTPKLNNQLPSPKTPSRKTPSLETGRPAESTPKAQNHSPRTSSSAQHANVGIQQSTEVPCFGSPLPLPRDPRLRDGQAVQHAGYKRAGEHHDFHGRAPKRPCSGNR
ncbi:hypothetical protein LTR85_006072 [Meristemomyces frigidus]|nr:hypothetical protein LTR85_006072 [Meristemomyces frigidus]